MTASSLRRKTAGLLVLALTSLASSAGAQQPLPQLPVGEPAPTQAPAPPPRYEPPPPPYYAPSPQPASPYPAPPPPVEYVEPPAPVHAPRYSLWLGGRLSLLGFGGNFFDNTSPTVDPATGLRSSQPETTGNFAKSGPALAVDVGARLGKRYIPYIGIEVAALTPGHRFEGYDDVHATASFVGIGFRYIGGDVDSVGFLSDLSFGVRELKLTRGSETYKMSAIEIFRLGLGAEIRLSTLVTLSPMFVLSGGAMTDTEGTITYSPAGSGDGITHPTFQNGQNIAAQRGYLVVSLGCGVHFDLFGK